MTGTEGTGGEIWALRERVVIRGLKHRELDEADRIMRLAFGTYLKAPNPIEVFGDADWVHTRHKADPSAAFCAELDGEVVGSNFATRWGSFGFFGPLTVRPDLWDGGIASRLMEPIMQLFEQWGVRHAGLFTFPGESEHVGLYQKFGFWPQGLNPVLARELVAPGTRPAIETFSTARVAGSGDRVLAQCRQVASTIYDGLDLTREILVLDEQGLGETVLIASADGLEGFAVCHCGAGSEAGSGACFVKFGAVLPGQGAERRFERLLDACEALAARHSLARVVAGMNTERHAAYQALLARGYRAMLNGLTMLRPNERLTTRPDIYAIDDLR